MLFARAMSNGAKWHTPDVFAGNPVYTADELGATVDGETGEVISVDCGASNERFDMATLEPTQVLQLAEVIRRKGADLTKLLKHYGVESLGAIDQAQYRHAISILEARPDHVPVVAGELPAADPSLMKES
jgi:hypothetical protein